MSGQRHIASVVGLTAMAVAGGTCLPQQADAQTLRPAIREDATPLPRLRPRVAPLVTSPQTVVEEPPPLPLNRARMRSTGSDTPEPGTAQPLSDDADFEQPPTGLRAAVRDGEPITDTDIEPQQPLDGVPDAEEAYRNPDGADPVLWDSRRPEDSEPFERPPAGNDPQAFSIELDPLTDRRPSRLFRLEPWEPRGIRVGSYTIFPSVDFGAAWLSNLFRSKPARSDAALELRPTIRTVSNWRVHALELRATGGFTFLDEFPKEDDRAYTVEARGRLDVTRRTSLSAGVLRDVAQESRGSLESRLRGGQRADVATDEARLTFDHRFNRLAVQLRASAQQRTYEDGIDSLGVTTSNRDRNVKATEEAGRLSWSFKPTFVAFTEAVINQRRFEAASSDGIKRDSDGVRLRTGIGFGNTGQVLRGEASIGWGRQTPLDSRLNAVDGIIIDANVGWRIDALTALLLTASSDIVETSTPLSGGGVTQRAQAEIRRSFTRPLIGSAFAGHTVTAYQGNGLTERQTDIGLGLEYYLGREAILFGRYQHSTFRSTAPVADWDADEVRVGMRLRK